MLKRWVCSRYNSGLHLFKFRVFESVGNDYWHPWSKNVFKTRIKGIQEL